MGNLLALAERLEKRAKEDRQYAENNSVAAALLKPELDKFDAREGPWNTYTVRMAIDHKRSAERDAAWADDLEMAAAILRTQSTDQTGERKDG